MKKRISIIMLCVGMLSSLPGSSQNVAQVELAKTKSLWFHSANAAGLSITPFANFNEVSISYDLARGDYKRQQQGDRESLLRFNTNGAIQMGKIFLWGDFSYDNHTSNDSKYNTTLFDPLRDMPYYLGDPVISKWKRQSYDLRLKAASPLIGNVIGFGLEADYTANTGAKQNDPRSTTYDYKISVRPALIFRFSEKHYAGVNFLYNNSFERTIPVISGGIGQAAYVFRGLGNYSQEMVGGGGSISTLYYQANRIGGGVQYGFTGKFSGLMELNYHYGAEDVFQQPTKPKRMGSVIQNVLEGKLQLMLEKEFLHKLTVGYYDKNTDGIEFIQVLDTRYEVQQWVTLAKYIRSNYKLKVITAAYDLFKGRDQEYTWRAGFKGEYSDKFDEYYLPNSRLAAENIYGEVYFKKNFLITTTSKLLTGLNVGYNKNLGGYYTYSGADADSPVVTDFYYKDMRYLTSNYFRLGAEVNYSFLITDKAALFLKGEAQWLKAASFFNNRLNAVFSVGLTF